MLQIKNQKNQLFQGDSFVHFFTVFHDVSNNIDEQSRLEHSYFARLTFEPAITYFL